MSTTPRVLVIDDEPHVRAFIVMLLKTTFSKLEIAQAGDDTTALALVASAPPDLVLLDINLIGVSGLDLLPRILALHPNAVVVMLTAVSVRQAIEEAQNKGASGYILKETNPEEMGAAIVEVVREQFGLTDSNPVQP
jgi:DNA-binding NarL/FixJ family response regulator